MIEAGLRVLAWGLLVWHTLGVIVTPYLVGFELKPVTPGRAMVNMIIHTAVVLVLWDYLR